MEQLFTISIFTENSPGVLHRITTIFTRRKINIESLTVSETEEHEVSRFTITIRTTAEITAKVVLQIQRVIEVRGVYASEDAELIAKEISFIRVTTSDSGTRREVEDLAHRYDATVAHATAESLTIEKSGSEEDIDALYFLLEPYGIKEFVRSGRIAIRKGA